jgi:hypothetical protein
MFCFYFQCRPLEVWLWGHLDLSSTYGLSNSKSSIQSKNGKRASQINMQL